MKKFFNNILNFLCLLDRSRTQLSLTNVVLIVVIVKIAFFTQTMSLTELTALLLSLLNYGHKRHLSNVSDKQAADAALQQTQTNNQLATLHTAVDNLNSSMETIANKQKEDSKIVSEAKTLLTANRLSGAMNRNQ